MHVSSPHENKLNSVQFFAAESFAWKCFFLKLIARHQNGTRQYQNPTSLGAILDPRHENGANSASRPSTNTHSLDVDSLLTLDGEKEGGDFAYDEEV